MEEENGGKEGKMKVWEERRAEWEGRKEKEGGEEIWWRETEEWAERK